MATGLRKGRQTGAARAGKTPGSEGAAAVARSSGKDWASPTSDRPVYKAGASRRKGRRLAIILGLRECMIRQGYAETTLTDIARAADMAVSHLLYYYESKEAVLTDLAQMLHERVLESIGASDIDCSPRERIRRLTDQLLVALPRENLVLLRDIIAAAGHSQPLRDDLSGFAQATSAFLEDLFRAVPRHPDMSAGDAAMFASVTWLGLLINASVDDRLDDAMARRLFRHFLLYLANFADDDGAADDALPCPDEGAGA